MLLSQASHSDKGQLTVLRQPTLELPLITASFPVTTITFVVVPLCANRGAGRKGLNFRVKGGRRQMFIYCRKKKTVTIALLNDYVLEPCPKYLCLCIQTRAAFSLFAVTTLNAEMHNSSKHWRQVTTECPCINSISTSLPSRLRELHGRGGGEGGTARLRRKALKMLSSGHDKAVTCKTSQQYILNYERIFELGALK